MHGYACLGKLNMSTIDFRIRILDNETPYDRETEKWHRNHDKHMKSSSLQNRNEHV